MVLTLNLSFFIACCGPCSVFLFPSSFHVSEDLCFQCPLRAVIGARGCCIPRSDIFLQNTPSGLFTIRSSGITIRSSGDTIRSSGIRDCKRQVNGFLLRCKRNFLSSSPQKFWLYVRSRPGASPLIPSLDVDTRLVTSDPEKVDVFNTYFCSVFTLDDGRMPSLYARFDAVLDNLAFDTLDVLHELLDLAPKLSRGPDEIPQVVFHKLAFVSALPLYLTFRDSLSPGLVAAILKKAVVVPLFKRDAKRSRQL